MVLIDLYNPNFRYVRHVRGHVRQVALVMVRGQQMHLKNNRNVLGTATWNQPLAVQPEEWTSKGYLNLST